MPTLTVRRPAVDRIRAEIERNARRARNGIKLAAGVDRPGVGLTPKDVIWRHGRTELWRYRNDDIRYRPPLLIVFSLVTRSYVLDLTPGNSFVEIRPAGRQGQPPTAQIWSHQTSSNQRSASATLTLTRATTVYTAAYEPSPTC